MNPNPAPSARPRQGSSSVRRTSFSALAFVASFGFVLTMVVDPTSVAVASPYYAAPQMRDTSGGDAQSLRLAGDYETSFSRDEFETVAAPEPEPEPEETEDAVEVDVDAADGAAEAEAETDVAAAPAVAAPDPGTAQAIAYDMVVAKGWSDSEFACLVSLWNRESGWNASAHNAGSGAYGIPQALPGSKMASAGADWATNPATQITWGLGYIEGRYGSPCGAWGHSESVGWY
ncbi:putative secreted protein [Mycetocola reblochoni REB411]|uniref:Putative secreted protein n=1 Tax=Mycetocola reblochoni REB411 TaxID=1255698 RepID=A0A1R4JCA0_9MICO|nr:putative secreted protein [Mycetocola reblochoni REB411]